MEKQRPPQEGVDYIVNRDPGDETGDGIEQMTRMAEAYQRDMREILPDFPIPTTGEIFDRQTHYVQRRQMNRPTRSGK